MKIDRVAEILVALANETGRRGSGYRVSADIVLTVAHVVHGASKVRIRFNADQPDEWMVEVSNIFEIPEADIALLTISPRSGEHVPPSQFGRIAERDAVIECSAVGFPLWKLRNDQIRPLPDGLPSQYRDTCHIVGTAAILANRREGTLEISVLPPEIDSNPNVSPWAGMSGAAVFSAGHIVGLIQEHHRSDGLGRLAAARIDRWYDQVPPNKLNHLSVRFRLPKRASQLYDVVPRQPEDIIEAAYTAQVRDIAPSRLMERAAELDELVAFCAGDHAYEWWQGPPWAGKTALAAWFALNPPAGVRIVSFFVTGRLAGQANSDAFTEAMIDQLAILAGEPVTPAASETARDGLRRHLIEAAADRIHERGERLVIVVDGLDEDQGAHPGSGRPSIASLLPRRPRNDVRVLVASREHPPLPVDVAGDHPLRHCPRRMLRVSAFARGIEIDARSELLERLHAGQHDREIVGLITAAGGGLTVAELAELTGRQRWDIEGHLGSVFGRSMNARQRYGTDDRVILFAHETLRATAEEILGTDLTPYLNRIHAWADEYRTRGWPDVTPRYLLQPYGRLLDELGDLGRLAHVAADSARHDRMLMFMSTDMAALTEISAAQRHLIVQDQPDLTFLTLLALERDRVATRNHAIPANLPAVWARLGRLQHAQDLARSILDIEGRARALISVAATQVVTDPNGAARLTDEAEQISQAIKDPWSRASALAAVATSLAEGGFYDRAEHIARTITSPDDRAEALAGIANALAADDPNRAAHIAKETEPLVRNILAPERRAWLMALIAGPLRGSDSKRALYLAEEAERVARTVTHPWAQAVELAEVAGTLAIGGFYDQAQRIARDIEDPWARAVGLINVAEALAAADPGQAIPMIEEAEHIVSAIPVAWSQGVVWAGIAGVLAAAGLWDRSVHIAEAIASPEHQVSALTRIAEDLSVANPEWALRLAENSELVARAITKPELRSQTLISLTNGLAAAGLWDRAERTVQSLPNPRVRARVLAELAREVADADPDRATHLADEAESAVRTIQDAEAQAQALAAIARALAVSDVTRATRLADQAEHVASTVNSSWLRARVLADIARALADTDLDRATRVAGEAERTAGTIQDAEVRAVTLATLTNTLTVPGLWDLAEHAASAITYPIYQVAALADMAKALAASDLRRATRLARDGEKIADSITDPWSRLWPLKDTAEALAAVGLWDRAEHAAHAITDPAIQALVLTALTKISAAAGKWDRAERIVSTIIDPEDKAQALATITSMRAAAGLWDHAEHIAGTITDPEDQAQALASIAEALLVSTVPKDGELKARLHRILGMALKSEGWEEVLPMLGRVLPEAVVTAYDKLVVQSAPMVGSPEVLPVQRGGW